MILLLDVTVYFRQSDLSVFLHFRIRGSPKSPSVRIGFQAPILRRRILTGVLMLTSTLQRAAV